MSNTNERKPRNAKTQQQIESTNYINQVLGGEKKPANTDVSGKIALVKSVVRDWHDEDIMRVLQDCNNDPQQAINNIMDGKSQVVTSYPVASFLCFAFN